jgi:hypothetical protein
LQLLGLFSWPLLYPDGLIPVTFELHPADIVCEPQPPNHADVCQCGSDHHGVDPVHHSGFQTTGLTRCALCVNSTSRISPRYFISVASCSVYREGWFLEDDKNKEDAMNELCNM